MADKKKEVVGIRPVSYTRQNGDNVRGVNVFCVEPLPSPGIGFKTVELFFNGYDIDDFHLGPYVTILYEPGYSGRSRATGIYYGEKGGV